MGTGAIVSGVAAGGSAREGAVAGALNPQAVNSTASSRPKQHRQTGVIAGATVLHGSEIDRTTVWRSFASRRACGSLDRVTGKVG